MHEYFMAIVCREHAAAHVSLAKLTFKWFYLHSFALKFNQMKRPHQDRGERLAHRVKGIDLRDYLRSVPQV
jgi:hypothetical protein